MDLAYAREIVGYIAMGAGVTLQVFAVTLVFSIPIGILCAIGKLSRFRVVRFLISIYTWVFRGTPLLLQLFFTYYGLAILTNGAISLEPLPAALLTFVFNYAAYFTEIFRAGIQSIGRGQYEASKALGMPHWLMMRRIILPQAVKIILPPMGNEAINLIKDTALCSVITITEILRNAQKVMSRDFNITALVIAACIYLALTFIVILLFRRLEKRFAYYSIK
ncbi:MAG: amino acid ABC transporter permease [Clostridiales Family XIII bacterium]|nr:amino acid ABC transporter permease [Clostridiales Family XIII bacterium]